VPDALGDADGGVPDTGALMADIEREVRERRRAGEIDDDYERELDRIFNAVAPPGAVGSGLDAALMRAERAAVIDPVGPVASRLPGVALLRRVLRKLMAFYVEHVARQVTAFGVMSVRAMRLLGERLDSVETRSPNTDPRLLQLALPISSDLDLEPWRDVVVKTCSSFAAPGRVLHAECGDGALLVAMHDAGVDAYGIDPRADAAAVADERRVEVRTTGALEHLRAVPAVALGGVVLSGCTERLAAGDIVELVDLAAAVLAPGAPIVVLSRDPSGEPDPIAADLAPGKPLHAQTWAFLLARRGFGLIDTRTNDTPGNGAPASYAVVAVRAGS
jgi:Methyltransferase domain